MNMTIRRSGYMQCVPGHSFGPIVHECFLFHLICSGSGFYEANGQRHALGAGQGFLIWPGKMAYYEADQKDPWCYVWIGFQGADALRMIRGMGLSAEKLIWEPSADKQYAKFHKRILQDVMSCRDALSVRSIVAGDLLSFLTYAGSHLGAPSTLAAQYCEKSLWYMRTHLNQNVTVEKIADLVGLSRSQLFRVFRETYGKPPRQVLALVRTEQAQYMLRNTSFPLEQIAFECGYANESHLCAAFKRACGLSPTEYRNAQDIFAAEE